MLVQVKPLRQRGARLTDYQIQAQAPAEGRITVYGLVTTIQLSLTAPDDQQGNPLLAPLYDARLVTMSGAEMLFSGIECTVDPLAAQYLQECSVLMVSV